MPRPALRCCSVSFCVVTFNFVMHAKAFSSHKSFTVGGKFLKQGRLNPIPSSKLSLLPQRVAEREIDDCLVVSVFSCVVIVFSQRSQAHILIREDAQRLDASAFLLCDHKDEQVAKKSQQAQGRRPHPEKAALSPPCLKPES